MDLNLTEHPTGSSDMPYVSLKIGLGVPIVLEYRQAIRMMDILATAEVLEPRYGSGSESIEPVDESTILWRFISSSRYRQIKERGARIRREVLGETASPTPTPAPTPTTPEFEAT